MLLIPIAGGLIGVVVLATLSHSGPIVFWPVCVAGAAVCALALARGWRLFPREHTAASRALCNVFLGCAMLGVIGFVSAMLFRAMDAIIG